MLTYSMKLLCGPTDMTFYVTSSISQIFLPWKQSKRINLLLPHSALATIKIVQGGVWGIIE